MQTYDHTNEQQSFLSETLEDLRKINKHLAEVGLIKEELTKKVISALQHEHEGQKTYEYGVYKIEVKTPFIYSLNKKLYESKSVVLPKNFNPIKESISYSVDKNLCEKYMEKAPKKVRDALVELIDKKPGKPTVTIKERV